jgi:hypothetical protein
MARILHPRRSTLGKVLLCAAVSLGVPIAFAPSGSATRSAAEQTSPPPAATIARTISLNETGHLRLTSKHNFTLNERGSASGTIAGVIYVALTAVSSSRVTVTVNIYPPGGSISGSGAGTYRRTDKTASFSGSMSFRHGTGRYAHAHGSGLSFSGTIQESRNDAITVYVRGRVSD